MACPEAAIGWGVPLIDRVGWSPHPSIRHLIESGSPLLDANPVGAHEKYWGYLEVTSIGYTAHPRCAYAVYLERSLHSTGDSAGYVDRRRLVPPTPDEFDTLQRYLDETGFTGDREVRLLLTAKEV